MHMLYACRVATWIRCACNQLNPQLLPRRRYMVSNNAKESHDLHDKYIYKYNLISIYVHIYMY